MFKFDQGMTSKKASVVKNEITEPDIKQLLYTKKNAFFLYVENRENVCWTIKRDFVFYDQRLPLFL